MVLLLDRIKEILYFFINQTLSNHLILLRIQRNFHVRQQSKGFKWSLSKTLVQMLLIFAKFLFHNIRGSITLLSFFEHTDREKASRSK